MQNLLLKRLEKLFFITSLAMLFTTTVEATTLKIATIAPEGTAWVKKMRAAAKEIKIKTEGRVKIKLYPGGVMGDEKSVLRKMRIGQLHGGAFTSGGLSSLYPDMQIYSLPMLFKSYEEINYVRQHMDEQLKAGLSQHGLIALGITDAGFAYIMSDTRVSALPNLKGKKLWVPEGDILSRSVYEAARLSPVSLPISDVYTGLQTGLIDTIAGPPAATLAFQWHTKVKHLTDTPLMYLTGVLALTQKSFARINKQDQVIIKKIIGDTIAILDKIAKNDHKQAKIALEKQNIQFDTPTNEELQFWQSISDKAIVELGKKNMYTPAMLKKIRHYLEEFHSRERARDTATNDNG